VLFRAARIAAGAEDLFGRLVATGVLCWFTFQSFENIGMCLGIMPVTGLPLPFVSYGGSSMFANLIAVGLLPERPHAPLRVTHVAAGPRTLVGMPLESVFPRLEALLPRVQKPIQYVGGELNSTVKEWDSLRRPLGADVPDAYEVGVPNQGVMILYEVLNEQDGVLAERTYSVWPDLEALMREHGVPQFTVDAHRPVAAFDLFGVSFSTELGYTNMLTALDLAGIPLDAATARATHPSCSPAGTPRSTRADRRLHRRRRARRRRAGRAARSPTSSRWKAQGSPGGRDELLLRLARRGGSTSRASTTSTTCPTAASARRAEPPGVPWRVSKHTVMDLDAWPYPKQPLVPLAETVHERMSWRSSAAAPAAAGSARPA
jgi:hypothetical protein